MEFRTPDGSAAWRSDLMPLGFHPHPGGMLDNSPTFQNWVPGQKRPESRRDDRDRVVPRPSLRDYSHIKRLLPTLKRWAIVACPSGTGMWPCFRIELRSAKPGSTWLQTRPYAAGDDHALLQSPSVLFPPLRTPHSAFRT
jgi:hypothetical protein